MKVETGQYTSRGAFHAGAAAAISGMAVAAFLHCVPSFASVVLAQAAAKLAGLVCGSMVVNVDAGYAVPGAAVPILVTAACSAGDFACVVAALVTFRLVRRGRPLGAGCIKGMTAGVPLAIGINGLRLIAVAHAHRWIIPHCPPEYGPALHLATGVAVFLPALIALNAFFQRHDTRPSALPE